MDEKSLPDLFSHIIPDALEDNLGLRDKGADESNDILIQGLKTAAGQTGGPLAAAVEEFLTGKGELHENALAAVTRSKKTAEEDIAAWLKTQFKLSPIIAGLIAPLVVKLLASISSETEKDSQPRKKPRRKTKPKSESGKKAGGDAKPKKPKKKPASRPKSSTSKPAPKKKKPASQAGKKETKPSPNPKSSKKTGSAE